MAKVPIWNFCNVDNVCKELMSIIKLIIVFLCTVPMAFYKCTNSRRPCSYLTSPSAPPVMVWLPSGVNLIIARPSEWAYLIADTLIFDWSTHKTFEERHCKTPMLWLRLEWLNLNTFLFQICSNIKEKFGWGITVLWAHHSQHKMSSNRVIKIKVKSVG